MAAIAELVKQRTSMRDGMMQMHGQMMGHMMQHMAMGASPGVMEMDTAVTLGVGA